MEVCLKNEIRLVNEGMALPGQRGAGKGHAAGTCVPGCLEKPTAALQGLPLPMFPLSYFFCFLK
jgi:hypothetical protein